MILLCGVTGRGSPRMIASGTRHASQLARLPEATAVRVHDSTADCRYVVLPERPSDTEGWSEAELAALVSRDSMIGVTLPNVPAAHSPLN